MEASNKRSATLAGGGRLVDPGSHFSFTAVEQDGSVHEVPFHRVREVHRDGVLIWQRPAAPSPIC
jgi:hypothetical protein